jgi:hypothetical protein
LEHVKELNRIRPALDLLNGIDYEEGSRVDRVIKILEGEVHPYTEEPV